MSEINVIIYLASGIAEINKNKSVGFVGGHGYTYNLTVEGKKKLAKDVPTTVGYYTGETSKSDTVVTIENVVSIITPNDATEFDALFNTIKIVLEKFSDDSYNNIAIILKNKFIPALLSDKDCTKLIEKFGINDKTLLLISEVKALIKQRLIKNKKVWFDLDGSVVGGLGNITAAEQCNLAEITSLWSSDKECNFSIAPLKEYNNPESDFNKIVCASRWFFNTGEGYNFHENYSGYRRYDFGKIDPDKKYYGKATPDVTYGSLFVKEPVVLLDKLYDYAKAKLKNPNELILAGNLQYVKSKDVARLIDTYPGIKSGKDLVVPFKVGSQDEPTLIELIDPPGLSYRIKGSLDDITVIFNAFINKDELNHYGKQSFINITDLIYKKEENKKGIVKVKLADTFKVNLPVIMVDGFHPNVSKPVPIMLSVGYDIPERNNFNSVEDETVEVWCGLEFTNDKAVIYRTITQTKDWIYIHTSACANVRVLNKSELAS